MSTQITEAAVPAMFQGNGDFTDEAQDLVNYLMEEYETKQFAMLSPAAESFASLCLTHPIESPGEWVRGHKNHVQAAWQEMQARKGADQKPAGNLSAQQTSGIAEALAGFRTEFANELKTQLDDFRTSMREELLQGQPGQASSADAGAGAGNQGNVAENAQGGATSADTDTGKRRRTSASADVDNALQGGGSNGADK